jgi:WD40 repeat protein
MKKTILFISVFLVLILGVRIHSSGVPEEPILRMEIVMHSAWITSIAVDAQNEFIVTGSQDKTVRLWELSTGRLVRIFRPPIAEGGVGMILTVTFSPDEKTIVCGGVTKSQKEESYSVYFFDRESGELVNRIAGLSAYVTHLAFSKDGKFLVVGMAKGGGIRIYRASDYFIVKEDTDYGEAIFGVDFDPKGRLVTVSYDGFLRLYGNDFNLITKKKGPEGLRPNSVRFSPEG